MSELLSSHSDTPKASNPASIRITAPDMKRLRESVDRYLNSPSLAPAAEMLEVELDRATVVPAEQVSSDVVTMRARVVVEEVETGRKRELSLVYPEESNPSLGKISVLAPVGVAILGLKVGDCIDWPLPRGRSTRLRILDVPYQPEAAGDFDL